MALTLIFLKNKNTFLGTLMNKDNYNLHSAYDDPGTFHIWIQPSITFGGKEHYCLHFSCELRN